MCHRQGLQSRDAFVALSTEGIRQGANYGNTEEQVRLDFDRKRLKKSSQWSKILRQIN